MLADAAQVSGLLAGEARRAQVFVGDSGELGRLRSAAAEECEEAALDRRGGGASELLVEHGAKQRLVRLAARLEREIADALDDAAHDRIGLHEVETRGLGIV